jgi:aminoglycoside phosphotransferase (APT) family kinase protein
MLRTYSRLFPFTILSDGMPAAEILVKVPQGRKGADVRRAFQAQRMLAAYFAGDPHLDVAQALAVWEDPPALIMTRAEGMALHLRMQDCRNWAGESGCQLTRHFIKQAGRWLARLHEMTPPDWAEPAPPATEQIESWVAVCRSAGMDPVEEQAMRQALRALDDRGAMNAPLHGDYTLRNILCRPPQHITVLDTELAFVGHPARDVGWFLAALHTIDKWQILGGEMVYTASTIRQAMSAFLAGYDAVRPLPDMAVIRAYAARRLLERWADFVQEQRRRNIAGLRVLVIRRINQHFARALRELLAVNAPAS